jgi:hypothetical protein
MGKRVFVRRRNSFLIVMGAFAIYFILRRVLGRSDPFFTYIQPVFGKYLTKLIVVAHYNEDVSWLDLYVNHIPHVLYTKVTPFASHNLGINKGNEATSYLKYIIDNYELLPDVIAFIHGHRYAWHQKAPDDIVVALQTLQWGRFPYMPLQTACTGTVQFSSSLNLTKQQHFNNEMWKATMLEVGSIPVTIDYYCCAVFAVTAHAIRQRKRFFYENLYNYLMATNVSNEICGRALEHTWHLVFGVKLTKTKKFDLCDLFHCNDTRVTNYTSIKC